jgi:DNA-binding GntR family transcriptional regulator
VDPSLTQRAYETLKSEIITCALAPGIQIAQRHLAETYALGLTPVREALQRLAQEGFVQAIPRFGYVVSPIALSDIREIFELRAILEAGAARLAARQASPEQLAHLAELARSTYTYQDRQSYGQFLACNAGFHRSIADAAGNQRLTELIARVLDELTRVFHLGLELRDSAAEMRDEHMALVEALQVRDSAQAEQLVLGQIARSQQRVLEALLHDARGSQLHVG